MTPVPEGVITSTETWHLTKEAVEEIKTADAEEAVEEYLPGEEDDLS